MTDQIDVLERLRNAERDPYSCIRHPDQRTFLAGDAADEIERLSFENDMLTARIEERTAYCIAHRGSALLCSDAMRAAYSDMTVRAESAERERDELRGRISAAPVIITDGTLQWAIHHLDNKRVRLVVEVEE